jgi:signal transduction histidine kinase
LGAESAVSVWERGFERVVEWCPYVTLAIGLILSLLSTDQEPGDRLISLGLAAVAALWVLFMFTRAGARRDSQPWVRVYFAGFIVLGALLMLHHGIFFVFVITGFIHAFLLKPAPVAFTGVALSSLVINMMIVYPNPTPDGWWTYGVIVVIQTTAVGFGILGGEKIGELSEQRRRALLELESTLEENAGLHAQLVAQAREAGVNDERQRMAREIHDTIAQGLTGIITQLEAAGQVRSDPDQLQRRLDNAVRLARESLAEARRSVRAVVPVPLEDRTLPDAITHVTERWSSLTHVPAEVVTTGTALGLHPEVEVTLLRVTQEALANIAKHATANRVGVTLSYMGELVTVDVRDDGVGFDPTTSSNGHGSGFGLTGMRQRVEGLSGTLEIESEPGRGTAISASLPAIPVGETIG